MAERIPQSVSYLVVFRAFLASDGKTPATGKTIAVTISKNGAAFGNPNAGATNATEISSGFYKFTLDATDTGTLGPLAWRGAEGTINDAGDVLFVVDANTGGLGNLDAAVSSRLAAASYAAPLDAAGTRAAVGLAAANLDTQLAALDADVLTRMAAGNVTVGGYAAGQDPYTLVMKVAMTEGYTTGAPTAEQAFFELLQVLGQFSIAGTTLTFQKRDKTTAAGTFTLNDGTNPTARTRAT